MGGRGSHNNYGTTRFPIFPTKLAGTKGAQEGDSYVEYPRSSGLGVFRTPQPTLAPTEMCTAVRLEIKPLANVSLFLRSSDPNAQHQKLNGFSKNDPEFGPKINWKGNRLTESHFRKW